MMGQQVRIFHTGESLFDVSDLKAGMYIFEIKTDQGLIQKKIIKQ
jgi:hypothetical protein